MSCNITKQQIHKSLLDKSFEIALTKNKAYFINNRGEIGLMVNPKVISENTPYRVRQKIDILSRKLAKDLNIPIDKYGVVFGGKTYTDGAALEIIVTPRLLEAYQVKNNEKKIEEAFVEEPEPVVKKEDSKSELKREAKFEIRKLGDGQFLYAGDIYPSREDAFRAFEEDNTPSIQEAQIPISQMDRIIDNLPPFTGDMEDLGFEEDACDL